MAEGGGEVVAVPASGAANGLSNGAGGVPAQTSNPLSRKLNKILETRLDNDKEMLEALKALSTFFVENSLRTRRNLRGDIERRSLAINEEFVSIFKEVKEELESINEDVQAMSSCCQDMKSRLQDFFKALGRVKRIHNDVKVLLRTNQQTAGLEIMEQMALLQETAYERLYRWAQNSYLFIKYTLDEFGTARRSTVVRGFIDALTRGGPGGTPRPIEMHSHDPLRYVGDMLAWLHQATASEKEHLEALLKNVTIQGVEENIQEVVGHITEGVCRPLKVRIEQVIVAEPGAVLLYKISNLLKFYHHTISGIVGNSATTLLTTIEEMHLLSKKIFFNCLSLHASKLMDKGSLANLPNLDSVALKAAMVQFDRYLSAPDSLLMPQLNFLLSTTVKEQIIKQSTELVCRAYGEVYAAVMNPVHEYRDPESILHRSPQQVHTLLS
ncbi:hypothetical protein GH733_006695 [Mirounga leonina]|nr:hypothetical protein GH733_006695 [Mirounga leonina]